MKKGTQPVVKTLQPRGNGLCVVIPRVMLEHMAWNRGDAIALEIVDKHIVLTKVDLPKIADLRKGVDEQEKAERTA